MQSTGAGSHLSAALTQSQKCPSSFFSVTESEGLFHHKYSILCDNQGQKEKKMEEGDQDVNSEEREIS